MALIQQALLVDGLEGPPLGLDVVIMVGDVGVLHVDPVTHLVGHFLPVVQVLPDRLLALADEGLDAILFDLRLAVQAEDLLDLQLNGQTMGIPAGLTQDVLSLHGVEAGEEILDDAGLDVADVGLAVGRGRAIVEGEGLAVLAVTKGTADHVVLLPQRGDLFLTRGEIHVGCYFLVHWFSLL